MTQASTDTRVTVEHRYTLPYNPHFATDWHAFEIAKHWAEKKAASLGIDTSCADWSTIVVDEDEAVMAIVVSEVLSAKESLQIQTSRDQAQSSSTTSHD